jgi:hypothetical protein
MASPSKESPIAAPGPTNHPEPDTPLSTQFFSSNNRNSTSSTVSTRLRSASLKLIEADASLGFFSAPASVAAKAPSIADIRRGSYKADGWEPEVQAEVSKSRLSGGAAATSPKNAPPPALRRGNTDPKTPPTIQENPDALLLPPTTADALAMTTTTTPQRNTQQTPSTTPDKADDDFQDAEPAEPKVVVPWTTSTKILLLGYAKWVLTLKGFLITIYFLNVVAWGGMLFLLLCNAAPAMCRPTCNDINSPRRIWIEIDSQILNALFCVTGFGLAPWRFRDLYLLLSWRFGTTDVGLRRLAGIHRGWFRLAGCENWNRDRSLVDEVADPSVPLPVTKRLDPPVTGVRAPPTKYWKLDFYVWMNVWNTLFQICLAVFMWAMNRYTLLSPPPSSHPFLLLFFLPKNSSLLSKFTNQTIPNRPRHTRPPWTTGLFIGLAFGVAIAGGIVIFQEGKRVKRFEGVPRKVGGPGPGHAPAKMVASDVEAVPVFKDVFAKSGGGGDDGGPPPKDEGSAVRALEKKETTGT